MNYLDSLIEGINKLVEFFDSNKELSLKYEAWKEQLKKGEIEDIDLAIYLNNQLNYYSCKDREYGKFIENILINNNLL